MVWPNFKKVLGTLNKLVQEYMQRHRYSLVNRTDIKKIAMCGLQVLYYIKCYWDKACLKSNRRNKCLVYGSLMLINQSESYYQKIFIPTFNISSDGCSPMIPARDQLLLKYNRNSKKFMIKCKYKLIKII